MDLRELNIKRQHDELGIVLASLESSDRECPICRKKSLRILGEGFDNRTNYICTNKHCNCRNSLA